MVSGFFHSGFRILKLNMKNGSRNCIMISSNRIEKNKFINSFFPLSYGSIGNGHLCISKKRNFLDHGWTRLHSIKNINDDVYFIKSKKSSSSSSSYVIANDHNDLFKYLGNITKKKDTIGNLDNISVVPPDIKHISITFNQESNPLMTSELISTYILTPSNTKDTASYGLKFNREIFNDDYNLHKNTRINFDIIPLQTYMDVTKNNSICPIIKNTSLESCIDQWIDKYIFKSPPKEIYKYNYINSVSTIVSFKSIDNINISELPFDDKTKKIVISDIHIGQLYSSGNGKIADEWKKSKYGGSEKYYVVDIKEYKKFLHKK